MEGEETVRPARAWVDEADTIEEAALPAFQRPAHALPAWATPGHRPRADDDDDAGRKRPRSDGLAGLLSQTAPLLESRTAGPRAGAGAVRSVLPLPRDAARAVHWHPSGALAVVGGNRHVYAFHAAGGFVERLAKVEIGGPFGSSCLTPSGEAVLVAARGAAAPAMLALGTEQWTALRFLGGRRGEDAITRIAAQGAPSAPIVALACGRTVRLGALGSASVLGRLVFDDPVSDLCFPTPTRLAVAAGTRVLLYDLRQTASFAAAFRDEAVLNITSLAWGPRALALGSSSGVVSLYTDGDGTPGGDLATRTTATPTDGLGKLAPVKIFKNLTTAIQGVCFGKDSDGEPVLAFSTHAQKAGFRLARLPSCVVVPGFPSMTMRHGFVQSLAMSPTLPILSVGERQKVTNYIL